MNNSNLEFRKIPSLKFLYEINSNGTILRNVKSKKQILIKLNTHHSDKGYYCSFIHSKSLRDGKPFRVMIHRLVAECWLGVCPAHHEVDHVDHNSRNNNFTNLRYVTKSEQMKNRDHSKISKKGSQNLEDARRLRMKPVRIHSADEDKTFESYAACSRYLAKKHNVLAETIRYKLKAHRRRIFNYNIEYLRNAETVHDCFTEQETVQQIS